MEFSTPSAIPLVGDERADIVGAEKRRQFVVRHLGIDRHNRCLRPIAGAPRPGRRFPDRRSRRLPVPAVFSMAPSLAPLDPLMPTLHPQPFEILEIAGIQCNQYQVVHIGDRRNLSVDERRRPADGAQPRAFPRMPVRSIPVVVEHRKTHQNNGFDIAFLSPPGAAKAEAGRNRSAIRARPAPEWPLRPLCSRSRRMTLAAGLGRSGSETVFVSSRYRTAYNRTSRQAAFPLCFRIPRPGRARAWRDRQLQRSPDTHRRIRAGPRQAARTSGDRPAPPPVRRAGSVPPSCRTPRRGSASAGCGAPLQSNVSRSFVGPSCSFRCTLYQVYTGTTLPRPERSGRTAGQFAETRTSRSEQRSQARPTGMRGAACRARPAWLRCRRWETGPAGQAGERGREYGRTDCGHWSRRA